MTVIMSRMTEGVEVSRIYSVTMHTCFNGTSVTVTAFPNKSPTLQFHFNWTNVTMRCDAHHQFRERLANSEQSRLFRLRHESSHIGLE